MFHRSVAAHVEAYYSLHSCLGTKMCSVCVCWRVFGAGKQVWGGGCGEEEGCTFVISQHRNDILWPHPPACCRSLLLQGLSPCFSKQQRLWPSSVLGLKCSLPVFSTQTRPTFSFLPRAYQIQTFVSRESFVQSAEAAKKNNGNLF